MFSSETNRSLSKTLSSSAELVMEYICAIFYIWLRLAGNGGVRAVEPSEAWTSYVGHLGGLRARTWWTPMRRHIVVGEPRFLSD